MTPTGQEPSAPDEQSLQVLQMQLDAEFYRTPAGQEIRLMKAKNDAEFSLTPVGQELKRFEYNQRMGKVWATSTIVPDTYKGNIANCIIAIDMSTRLGISTMMVMQNLYIVHNNPSWSSKFLIATVNTCGRFTPLRYECNKKSGDEYGWRCYAYEKSDKDRKERLEGPWVTWQIVKAEGWHSKPGSKWKTMAEQMFRYRAAAFWQRIYAPEISMGFVSSEELEDGIEDAEYTDVTHDREHTSRASRLAKIAAQAVQQPQQPEAQADDVQQQEPQEQATTADNTKAAEDDSPSTLNVDPATGELFD